jgi:hypothetical protein
LRLPPREGERDTTEPIRRRQPRPCSATRVGSSRACGQILLSRPPRQRSRR